MWVITEDGVKRDDDNLVRIITTKISTIIQCASSISIISLAPHCLSPVGCTYIFNIISTVTLPYDAALTISSYSIFYYCT